MTNLSVLKENLINNFRPTILPITIIVIFVSVLSLYMGAWVGDLKGDDAYLHLGRIGYFIERFPYVYWDDTFFAGYEPLDMMRPFYYMGIALLYGLTGIDIPMLMTIGLYIAWLATGISIYFLSRSLNIPITLSIPISLLLFTMSCIWNWHLIGGAYVRIMTLPLFFISIILIVRFIKQINYGHITKYTYLLTICTLTLTAIMHPLIWQWTALLILCVLLFGIVKRKDKLTAAVKLFLPVTLLSAWTYIPLLVNYKSTFMATEIEQAHDTNVMRWEWLIKIPQTGLQEWSVDIGTLILPIAMLSVLLLAICRRQLRTLWIPMRVEISCTFVLIIASIYFFLFAWLPMPSSLYLMAAYDYATFFGVSLLLLIIFSTSVLIQMDTIYKYISRFSVWIILMLLIVISSGVTVIPFLHQYIQIDSPINPTSYEYSIREITETVHHSNPPGYRIHSGHRDVAKWLNYSSTNVEITGGRSKNRAPYKYYTHWSDSVIGFKLDHEKLGEHYLEDGPQIKRPHIQGEENWYPPMFWLDWYAASGLLLIPSFYPQADTQEGYAKRPQYFTEQNVAATTSPWGHIWYYGYPESSPSAIQPLSFDLAVPYGKTKAQSLYVDLLDGLSSLNLNSQWIIPIALESTEDVEKFDIALVTSKTYGENKNQMDDFVFQGGHLVILSEGDTKDLQLLNLNLHRHKLSLNAVGEYVIPPEDSIYLASGPEGVIGYFNQANEHGTIAVSGISLGNLLKSQSAAASLFLWDLINPNYQYETDTPNLLASRIEYATEETNPQITYVPSAHEGTWDVGFRTSNATGAVESTEDYSEFQLYFDGGNDHDQVDFNMHLPKELPVSDSLYIKFQIWADHQPILDFNIRSGPNWATAPITYRAGKWTNNHILLSDLHHNSDGITSFDQLSLSVNDNPKYGLPGNKDQFTVRIRNVEINNTLGDDIETDNSELAIVRFEPALTEDHNQINVQFPLSYQHEIENSALISMDIWNNGNAFDNIDLVLNSSDSYLYYPLTDEHWTGWKSFLVPISSFMSKVDQEMHNYKLLTLVINVNYPYEVDDAQPEGNQEYKYAVRNVSLIDLGQPDGYEILEQRNIAGNKINIKAPKDGRILLKYTDNPEWNIKNNDGQAIDSYSAGPGMTYIKNVGQFQTVTFHKPIPVPVKLGYLVTASFLIYLAVRFIRGKYNANGTKGVPS